MHPAHNTTSKCPLCGRIMDHSGTKYFTTPDADSERKEVCPICYVCIEQGRLQKAATRKIDTTFCENLNSDEGGLIMTSRDVDLLLSIWKRMNIEHLWPELASALYRMVLRKAAPYRVVLELTREQVEQDIPYKAVHEAKNSPSWDTTSRLTRWNNEFSDTEATEATALFKQADKWTQDGIPATVRMSETAFDLWLKLGAFCASLHQTSQQQTAPNHESEYADRNN